MVEHRDPGAEGEPDQPQTDRRPREPEQEQEPEPEPEFGSSEWLLAQLTGGRRVDPATGSAADDAAAGVSDSGDTVAVQSAPGEGLDAAVAPASGGFDDLLRRPVAAPADETALDSDDATAPPAAAPQGFVWNLTSRRAAGDDSPLPAAGDEPGAPPAETDDRPSPVRRTNFVEPATQPSPVPESPPPFEPPSFVAALRSPGTPEPERSDALPASAEAAASEEPREQAEPAAPGSAAAPETDPNPSADEAAPLQGHGLAALLGANPDEPPRSRPLLGDTTGIIPLPPRYSPPPPEAVRHPDGTGASPSPSVPFAGAAQTEAILGAPPSPATSPLDAEALAAASSELAPAAAPAGADRVGENEQPPLSYEGRDAATAGDESEAADDPEAAADSEAGGDLHREPDGIAALFGEFVSDGSGEDDESSAAAHDAAAHAAAADGVLPLPEAGPAVPDATLLEPSGALEGPQFGPDGGNAADTVDLTGPPTVAFDTAAAAREPVTPIVFASPEITLPGTTAAGRDAAGGGAAATAAPGIVPPSPTEPPSEPPTGPRDPRFSRRISLVAAILAVLLVLVGLFALGTRIPSLFGASAPSNQGPASSTPSATPTPTPTPTPTVIPKPAAAVGPGEHAWDTLGGGECIQPYTTPWAETFTVVECTAEHSAQMVYTNLVSADPAAPYPGADALAQQIDTLCTAGGVIDLSAAGGYPDLQVQGTFPATEAQWKSGQRSYYCFASRSSGQPLTNSVQGTGPTS